MPVDDVYPIKSKVSWKQVLVYAFMASTGSSWKLVNLIAIEQKRSSLIRKMECQCHMIFTHKLIILSVGRSGHDFPLVNLLIVLISKEIANNKAIYSIYPC